MEKVIKKYYPEAQEGKELTKRIVGLLVDEHGFDVKKTILGTSVCSDEIIRSVTNFREHFTIKDPFSLGGLAGFPFAGITGLKAFAGHIPDGGSAIIIYGPHIGFSATGGVGSLLRAGQSSHSACCGALRNSLTSLNEKDIAAPDKELDYQQWKIESEMIPERDKITGHQEPIVAATDHFYTIIDKRIKRLLRETSSHFKGRMVALAGGIIINRDHGYSGLFVPREFSVHRF